jgi:hypothetical protein
MAVKGNRANFSTKANITDITNPGGPIPIGGNYTLIIEMLDSNTVGQADSVAITLQDNNGGLIYSSEWNGTRTIMRGLRLPTGAGNVKVSSGLAKDADEIPTEYALYQNYPNPFNPSTTIQFDLPEDSRVKIVVYDILGREVTSIADGVLEAGRYKETWEGRDRNGRSIATGVYIFRIEARSIVSNRNLISVKKMLLMK